MDENMETTYYKHHVVVAFFVGLVVGLGAYYVWDNRGEAVGDNKNGVQVGEEIPLNTETVMLSKNSVSVSNQFAGFVVYVDAVTLAQDGWIVVQEDIEGQPGPILGAARRDQGTYENIDVELLRNTEEGNIYYATIYSDDGDKEFDNKTDGPITTSSGNPVMTTFEIVRR